MTWTLQTFFGFKNPPIAIIVFVLFVMTAFMVGVPHGSVEKLGFTLAMGLGVAMMTHAVKAMAAQAWKIAVWMVVLGAILLVMGIMMTPDEVFKGSVLDEFGSAILGAMIGLIAKVEEV